MEWRMSSRPSSLLAVTMATESPSETTASKSTGVSLTMPASAARASPAPMEAATSATVAPVFSSLTDPSGSTMFMELLSSRRARTERLRGFRRGVDYPDSVSKHRDSGAPLLKQSRTGAALPLG